MTVLYIILGVVAAFFVLEFILFLAAFGGRINHDFAKNNFAARPELRKYADRILPGIKYINDTPHETVEIRSFDGVRLCGSFYDCPSRRGIVIMCHGYRSMARTDFSCSAQFFHSLGFAMLLIDQRAHGRSGGFAITFGIRERRDVIEWARYISRRFPGERIILEGLSMGATTVVMAAGEELPDSVVGVLADCGYTSPREIICSVIDSAHLPSKIFYPLLRLSALIYGRFDPDECSAVDAARRATLPALFIHGEADDFVPCDMGRTNYAAWAGPKRLITVPGATHGLSYVVDMERCQEGLISFTNEVAP